MKFSYEAKSLEWDLCIDHFKTRALSIYYGQLFFIYVIPTKSPANKYIEKPSYHHNVWFPETTYNTKIPNITRLIALDNKKDKFSYVLRNAFCLTASDLKENAPISMKKCSNDVNNRYQNLLTIHSEMDGSHPLSTLGQMKFAAAPHLCVTREDNKKFRDIRRVFPESNDLYVKKCDWNTHYHRNTFEFELILS